jgi:hypothetical protein
VESKKARLAQSGVARPFGKSDLSDELGLVPQTALPFAGTGTNALVQRAGFPRRFHSGLSPCLERASL